MLECRDSCNVGVQIDATCNFESMFEAVDSIPCVMTPILTMKMMGKSTKMKENHIPSRHGNVSSTEISRSDGWSSIYFEQAAVHYMHNCEGNFLLELLALRVVP